LESIEAKGKSVDEAIFNGLNELGLGIDEVEIEIIHEGSKGIFGIGKSALVRLSPKTEEDKKAQSAAIIASETTHAPEVKNVVPGDSPAEVFLNGLFKKMKVDAVAAGSIDDESKIMKIDIVGKDTAVLIGRRGDTLDAIQYITGLVVNKGKEDYLKIMLDAENYRRKREATLEKLAKRLANNAVKSGKPVTLEPMNPYERRILHATLQSNPKVETYSEGEEPYRRVVIRKKRRED